MIWFKGESRLMILFKKRFNRLEQSLLYKVCLQRDTQSACSRLLPIELNERTNRRELGE